MAFPDSHNADRQNSNTGANVTSHVITLPDNIVSGDLLLVFVTIDGFEVFGSWPAGWTKVFSEAAFSDSVIECYKRTADETEGSTITVTTSASEGSAHQSYRITEGDSLEFSLDLTGANDEFPDSPNLTPTWGAKDTLWLAICFFHPGNRFFTGSPWPSGYATGQQSRWADAEGVGSGTATRQLNATSENPGVFEINTNAPWVSATIAIEPSPSGTTTTATLADLEGVTDQIVSTVTTFITKVKLSDGGPDTGVDTSLDTVRTYQMSEKLRP